MHVMLYYTILWCHAMRRNGVSSWLCQHLFCQAMLFRVCYVMEFVCHSMSFSVVLWYAYHLYHVISQFYYVMSCVCCIVLCEERESRLI